MKRISVFALLFCLLTSLHAQDKVIQGIVTTFDSIMVVGANIKVKSTKQVFTTDSLGRFTAQVNDNDKLKVFAHGFFPQTVHLSEKHKAVAVNLKLKPGEKAREYAIGYGHVTDKERLSAVAQLANNDADFSSYSNLYEVIKGRFAGVQVLNNGDIIIRGTNSIMASSSALIVIDDVVVDKSMLGSISPITVKSIDVLKDAGSSIYGSRGANGVILIQTKRGNE